mgnify:CR=1 FL=1
MEKYLLNNPHEAMLVLLPKAGLALEQEAALKEKLAERHLPDGIQKFLLPVRRSALGNHAEVRLLYTVVIYAEHILADVPVYESLLQRRSWRISAA